MGEMHARRPKNFVLEERLERYASAIELDPARYAGRWAEACYPLAPASTRTLATGMPAEKSIRRFREVHLDLGCGKGSFVVEAARQEPDVLFIGMDGEPVCIAYAAQRIVESGLKNAVVVPGIAANLANLFAPGELSAITVNFPTPHPKARAAEKRLTSFSHLDIYRTVLGQKGTLTLRTDSAPFLDFSLEQFSAAGYRIDWVSRNVRDEHPSIPSTEYEKRLAALGATVYGACVLPGPACKRMGTGGRASLVDYLPADLSTLEYIPYGMERAVMNLRNQQSKRTIGQHG